ncbi:hypothetical protein GCM10009632_19220 [Mycolicibacterium alvei]|uniref:Uncharacterized protein n=1 Tax=Mycolicibacterium alvei TaxID=67081 RepID=A0A6N4UNB3_9MYCO|nr:hypothetical protein MALV_01560 [Mycolicibacterium alvei]
MAKHRSYNGRHQIDQLASINFTYKCVPEMPPNIIHTDPVARRHYLLDVKGPPRLTWAITPSVAARVIGLRQKAVQRYAGFQ